MTQASTSTDDSVLPPPTDPVAIRRRRARGVKDYAFRQVMGIGGVGVIIAIVLIFFYLLYVVLPVFQSADMTVRAQYPLPGSGAPTALMAVEEYGEVGLRVATDGRTTFFDVADGRALSEADLPERGDANIVSAAYGDLRARSLALGLDDGRAYALRHRYTITYPEDRRAIAPQLDVLLGGAPVQVDPKGRALVRLAAQSSDDQTTFAAVTEDGRLVLTSVSVTRSFLDDTETTQQSTVEIPAPTPAITHIVMNGDQRELYIASGDGYLTHFDITDKAAPRQLDRVSAVPKDAAVTDLRLLAGGISVLVGDSRGRVTQWFPVRDANNQYTLAQVRHLSGQRAAITAIAPEHARKGFAAADASGVIGLYHTTAERTLLVEPLTEGPVRTLAYSARAETLLAEAADGRLHVLAVHNPHPEVSFKSLWGKVWYESRQVPEYVWQSSSASDDFEPKFSLTPLTFGTLKGALYAMAFAVPFAIMGAVYTGYFMSARMRNLVKPVIEVMAALPTVILGFLAGLWLAPLVEERLPGIVMLLVTLPLSTLVAAWVWTRLPAALRHRVPDGWEAALLMPVICLAVAFSLWSSPTVETLLFDGDAPAWVTRELGLAFDQRNALVVGLAMGFAVIPIIFSISEDAIFGVPKHLTIGSLALGATPWQTLVRVVLLTASPGIFSGVMIGFGRAIGETMIVLMATGNTPVMDLNIFQGFRALSANVATEMPESAVGSTHFRILFLAALVLFVVTFLFNTAAEVVRQRLRVKYSSL